MHIVIPKGGLRFAVIHLGPRQHYAVPAVLEQAGLLQAVYTDAHTGCASVRPLGWLPGALQPRGLRRLLSRRIPAMIPRSKIHSWAWPSFQIKWFNRREPFRCREARFSQERGIGGHWLARRAIADNFGGANALYVHPCVSTDAVREAKRRGMYVVLAAISHPFLKRVELSEYQKFGTRPPPDCETILNENNLNFFKEEALLADLVLAPSPYMRGGLIELGLDPARIAVVPYGLDSGFFHEAPAPQPGRVLYVGNIGYLKGVPYLAEAARGLNAEGFIGEIRAVGPHDGRLVQRAEFQGPRYIGQAPRAEVKQEFLSADVFVFPTLSDGFGIVLLEAMAAGLPVICTPNCASVIRDGEDGFVVPVRDPAALAERIRQLTRNRELRTRMSRAALQTSADYTLMQWQRRLLSAIEYCA